MASDPYLVGTMRSIVDETARESLDEAGGLVTDARRSRPKYFDGRFLTARDLTADQRYTQIRQGDLGRAAGWGVVHGLNVWRGAQGDEIVIGTGLGITPAGETVALPESRTIRPLELRARTLADAHKKMKTKQGSRAGAFVLGLRPIEYTDDPKRGYPTEVHGERPVVDHVLVDATAVVLEPWATRFTDAQAARRGIVREIFVNRSGRALPPDFLPLAVVWLDETVRWVDVDMVRRLSGGEATTGFGLSPRGLRLAHVRQYANQLREALASGANWNEASKFTDVLPPVGAFPIGAFEPAGFKQRFFPSDVDVDVAVVPRDEVGILVEESLSLPPIDLLAGERALQGVSVLVLLPVARERFRAFTSALQSVQRPVVAGLWRSRLASARLSLRMATPAPTLSATWAAVFAEVAKEVGPQGVLWYVRRRNLNVRAEIPGYVDVIDVKNLPNPQQPDPFERRVVISEKNSEQDILALGNPGEPWARVTLAEAIADIEQGRHVYYVQEGGFRSEVHVVKGPSGKYLRTDPDETGLNNLDNLPDA